MDFGSVLSEYFHVAYQVKGMIQSNFCPHTHTHTHLTPVVGSNYFFSLKVVMLLSKLKGMECTTS